LLAAKSLALDNPIVPDLIAQGPQPDDRWRHHLESGDRVSIGRQSGRWSTPWDNHISRRHIEVVCVGSELAVQTLPGATNPVFFLGKPTYQFRLKAGEQIVIGKTTFLFIDPHSSGPTDLPSPTEERTFIAKELHERPFRESDKRIELLSRLPDVIHRSANDQQLFQQLANLLLDGVDHATAAAVVQVEPPSRSAESGDAVSVLHLDHRLLAAGDFRPSRRLIRQAVTTGDSVAYVWGRNPDGQADFTSSGHTQWAICTPVLGEATPGWALYVAGNFGRGLSGHGADAELLQDDVKYAEIMAATLGGLLQSRCLAARQASLSQFFSPVVLSAINASDPEQVLNPREAELTVLFCDLRGFTSESERSAHDLFGLLNRVSDALGVMTRAILSHGGVIGDFHGDAAMGFWGWPIGQPDAAIRACRAALVIRAHFEQADSCGGSAEAEAADSKHKFRVGIGIASGRAVAGKIGTADQVKVTAFGPVVNLAARLETMTRQLPASILVDSLTADSIRSGLGPNVCRIRRLARVLPIGLSVPIDVSEILPSNADCPELDDEGLVLYESALAAFEAGDWQHSGQLLASVPNADQAKDMLLQCLLLHDGAPPPNWDGAIRLGAK